MIAPGLRSRFGQPSSRLPMPGVTESSTVEWQMAQVMPSLVILPFSTVPCRPTTASRPISATVVAGCVEIRARQHIRRDSVGVDLEPDGECGLRSKRLRKLVKSKRVGPQLLVAERVVAKDALAVARVARPDGPFRVARATDKQQWTKDNCNISAHDVPPIAWLRPSIALPWDTGALMMGS